MVKKIYLGVIGFLLLVSLVSFGLAQDINPLSVGVKLDITYPLNGSIFGNNLSYFNWSLDLEDVVVDTCEYTLNSEDPVKINDCFSNHTLFNAQLDDGQHTLVLEISYNDSVGKNYNFPPDKSNFLIDTTYPEINMSYPPLEYYNYTPINFTYDYVETNPVRCWYHINGPYKEDINCDDFNVTGLTANEGNNNWTVFIEDIIGRISASSQEFIVDLTDPVVSIIVPNNQTYNDTLYDFNYTITEANLDRCLLNKNGVETLLFVNEGGCEVEFNNYALGNSEGSNNWSITVFDKVNHSDTKSVVFFVDSIFPTIDFDEITAEDGAMRSQDYIYAGVEVNETNFGNVTYELLDENNSVLNVSTFDSFVGDIIWNDLEEGVYYYNVSVTDILGHVNVTELRKITLDTTNPSINLVSPENNKSFYLNDYSPPKLSDPSSLEVYSSNSIDLFYYVEDMNGLGRCVLNVNSWLNGQSSIAINATVNSFTFMDSPGKYYWNVSCNDTSGNLVLSETRAFTIIPGMGSWEDGTNYTNLSDVNDISAVYGFFVQNEYSTVTWEGPLDLSEGNDLSKCVDLEYNKVYVNSTLCPELNGPAEIILNNLTWGDPQVLKDGGLCSDCVEGPYNKSGNNSFFFNVTGFSEYKTRETPLVSTPSSGGGGGSSRSTACYSEWSCTEWSGCSAGFQNRDCVLEAPNCVAVGNKPAEIQICGFDVETDSEPNVEDGGDGSEAVGNEPGFIAGITGAVVGALDSPALIGMIVFALAVAGAFVAVRIRNKKAISEAEELSGDVDNDMFGN